MKRRLPMFTSARSNMWRGSRANTRCAEEVLFTTEDTETRRNNTEPLHHKGHEGSRSKNERISPQTTQRHGGKLRTFHHQGHEGSQSKNERNFTTEDTGTRRENTEPSTTKGTKDHEVKTKEISPQRTRRARRTNSEPSTTKGTKDHKVNTKEISPQGTQRHGGKTQNLPPPRARRITK